MKSSLRLLAGIAVALWWCQTAVIANDLKSVDDIIAAYVKAIGGRAKLDAIKSLKVTGKIIAGEGKMDIPMSMEFRDPDRLRMELTFQGMTMIQAFDGSTGWFTMPVAGKADPEKMSAEQLKLIQGRAELHGPLADYHKHGHKLELVGKEDLAGRSTYKLKLTRKSGSAEEHYIDAETMLPLKAKGKHELMGTSMEWEVEYQDYKTVDGYTIAHTNRQIGGPQGVSTLVIEQVELNPKLADDRFTMPEAKKPETDPAPASAADEKTPEKKDEK